MSLVSIVIPVYNLEKYIKDCVNMFQKQTYSDFELIIVNDGSTDKSLEILKTFNDPRIQIFTVEKSNAGMARNFGLNKARGKWVIFFDGDDICEKTFLDKMVKKAEEFDTDITICASNEYIEKKQKFSNHRISHLLESIDDSFQNYAKSFDEIGDNSLLELAEPWNKIYKKEFLISNDIKFPNLPNSEDLPFAYEVILKAKKISFVKEILVSRRIRKSSVSFSADKNWINYFRAYKLTDEIVFNYKYFDKIKSAYFDRKFRTYAYFYKKTGVLNKIPYLLNLSSEIKNANNILQINKYNILNYLI